MNDLTKVRNALREHQPSPYSPYDPDGCGECTDYEAWPEHAAHAVVAALAPRRVETADELEALPYGAIVMLNHREGTEADVLQVSGDGDLHYFGSEIPRSIHGLAAREFPVRVLWIPEGEQ